MAHIKTRQMTIRPVFGTPKELPLCQLPTHSDVMRYYLLVKHEMKPEKSTKEPTVQQVSEIVVLALIELWHKSSLPTVSVKRIFQLIRAYHDKYRNLIKPYKKRQSNENYRKRIKRFEEDSQKFFDICSCKCEIIENCKCEKKNRVPKEEKVFLTDQRTTRKMVIGSIDKVATTMKRNKHGRKEIESSRLKQKEDIQKPSCSRSNLDWTNESDSGSSNSLSEITPTKLSYRNAKFLLPEYNVEPPCKQTRINLPSLALACDRTGVSDRSAAIIASAVLKDVGIITKNDKSRVIDRSKVRRERAKQRSALQNLSHIEPVLGLYFDGRKDKTSTLVKKGNRMYRKIQVEDHYVIVSEPGSVYFGHVTCGKGTAEIIKENIMDYLNAKSVDLNILSAVGCDGTVVNTGNRGGVIRLLEEELSKPLQWFICQLHSNKLPLRHLLSHLDGETKGPRCFSGPIGYQLQQCEKKPVVKLALIPTTLPVITKEDLSCDQKYLLEIMSAVSTGIVPDDLENKEPGPLNHSRWLTAANRILRLYISKTDPEQNLVILATFVMKVYGPMWFQIKLNPSCINGAKHLWLTMSYIRYLIANLKSVIEPVIQRNGYFGHPENILIAMLGDENILNRELAYRRIIKARSQRVTEIRRMIIPPFNFSASSYTDIIHWQECQVTEPPVTAKLSLETLQDIVKNGLNTEATIKLFPCHTQAVERCIKLVTEASSVVCGEKKRDGFIRARLTSRQMMPTFETKRQFTM